MKLDTYSKRPKVKIELTATDKTVEIVAWFALLALWGFILSNYSNLPEKIPTHFNGSGRADGYGTKANIMILPSIASILFIGMTLLNRAPHMFNYLTDITEANASIQYTNATRMMRYLKIIVMLIFGFIAWGTIQSSTGKSDGFGVWFLPFILGITFIPIAYFIIKSSRIK